MKIFTIFVNSLDLHKWALLERKVSAYEKSIIGKNNFNFPIDGCGREPLSFVTFILSSYS